MKAIILSAGQGRRLLPWTARTPKCLLPVRGAESVLEVQLHALAVCGVDEVCVAVGFGADRIEALLDRRPVPGLRLTTLFNPFFAAADNLITCWLARAEMHDDFVLMNGDTLFEEAVLERLLAAPSAPLTLAVNEKSSYDADDMKVSRSADGRLRAVGKDLPLQTVDAESIGLMIFRGEGPKRFRAALDTAVRDPSACRAWYLQVVGALAKTTRVETAAITGLWWGEVDSPDDLAQVRSTLGSASIHRCALGS